MDDILREIETLNLNDPLYDLEEPNFDRGTFIPSTPINTINRDLNKFKNKFTVAHINARSLNKNIEELREIIYKTSFDAVAVSETWLTKNSPKDRFQLNNYTVFRNDRKDSRGGGVLWYIRDHYKVKVLKTISSSVIPEMLWLEVSTAGKKVALGCLYRPPKLPYGVFANLYDSLISIYAKYEHTILVGDFNCNMLDLNAYSTKLLVDSFFEPFSLKQLIDKPTRVTDTSRTLIDLILVNKPQNALFSSCCDAPGVSDHFFYICGVFFEKREI